MRPIVRFAVVLAAALTFVGCSGSTGNGETVKMTLDGAAAGQTDAGVDAAASPDADHSADGTVDASDAGDATMAQDGDATAAEDSAPAEAGTQEDAGTQDAAGSDGSFDAGDAGPLVAFWACSVSSNIVVGADGALWFACSDGIGRMTTGGAFQDFPIGSAGSRAYFGVAPGADGNIWFTEQVTGPPLTGSIGRITPDGGVTEFSLTPDAAAQGPIPWSIASGGDDGSLWFTVYGSGQSMSIGHITEDGAITTYAVPWATPSLQDGITRGPDGNVWFTAGATDQSIGQIAADGGITQFVTPFRRAATENPSIVSGPEGDLWWSGAGEGSDGGTLQAYGIASITVGGDVAGYVTGVTQGQTSAVAVGPDGNLWFTDETSIYAMTPAGVVTRVEAGPLVAPLFNGPESSLLLDPTELVWGPDGNLWFTSYQGRAIGRFTP